MNVLDIDRSEIPLLINNMKLNTGVELGVGWGRYSSVLLEKSRLSLLYSIDAWHEFPVDVWKLSALYPQPKLNEMYKHSLEALNVFGERSIVMKMTSDEASVLFEDESLDFIYIDANHAYEHIKHDINIWYPKIRKNGLFFGHDFMNGEYNGNNYMVKKAVMEFTEMKELDIYATNEENLPSWMVTKENIALSKYL